VERAPLFRGLARAECEELTRLTRERRVVRKECFFLQGEPAEDVVLLCVGRVKMSHVAPDGDRIILRLAGPGEAFGALDVAPGATYSASAEALEPSHALLWDRRAIDAFVERNPVLLRNVIRIVAERMRSLEQRCSELSGQRVPQRVASTLLRLLGQVGRSADGGVLIGLSREELAEMTGTTLFSVSRLLGEWEAQCLVKPRREGVVVINAQRLAALADGNARDRAIGH
jgi:CRP/FNR family transcriptional regulator, nitrogen oxide reductase regulator